MEHWNINGDYLLYYNLFSVYTKNSSVWRSSELLLHFADFHSKGSLNNSFYVIKMLTGIQVGLIASNMTTNQQNNNN